MKKTLLFLSTLLFLPLVVQAQQQVIQAQVRDHYRDVVRQVPRTQTVCNQVQVPVHRNESNSGAIILGAIVGNALGAASGIEHGRTLGTVIGGVAGNQIGGSSPQVDHYRLEQRCHQVTDYETYTERTYSHSTVEFYHQGQRRELTFKR